MESSGLGWDYFEESKAWTHVSDASAIQPLRGKIALIMAAVGAFGAGAWLIGVLATRNASSKQKADPEPVL